MPGLKLSRSRSVPTIGQNYKQSTGSMDLMGNSAMRNGSKMLSMDPIRANGSMESSPRQSTADPIALHKPTPEAGPDQSLDEKNRQAELKQKKMGRASNGLGIASDVMNTASSMIEDPVASGVTSTLGAGLSGAAAGAMFGPIGIAIGATVGLVGGSIKAGITAHKEKQRQIAESRQYASKTMTQNQQPIGVG